MTHFAYAAVRLFAWIVLMLLIESSVDKLSAAQTTLPAANQRRSQLAQYTVASTGNSPAPSSLGAISGSVDAALDRHADADSHNNFTDPSLLPLGVTAPNLNGEDEAVPTQPDAALPLSLRRAKYSSFAAFPPFTPGWDSSRIGYGQYTPVLRPQSPIDALRLRHSSMHGSARGAGSDNTHQLSLAVSGAARKLRPTLASVQNHVDSRLHKQQAAYGRDCSKPLPRELQGKAKRQQQRSLGRYDRVQSYQQALAAIR